MIDEMSSLARKSWTWNLRFKFFKGRICNAKERLVYCCYEDQSPPSETQMKLIKTESSGTPSSGISDKVYYFSNFSCRFHREKNTLETKAECYANDKVKSPPAFRSLYDDF